MPHMPRIGIQIGPADPFWVQVREVIWQRAQTLPAELIEIDIEQPDLLSADGRVEVVEDLMAQELDALLCNAYPDDFMARILERGLPIIYVSETDLRHPQLTSRRGLHAAASMLGGFLHARLGGCGTVLIAGGHMNDGDSGQSRLDGFRAGVPSSSSFQFLHVPTRWASQDARQRVAAYLRLRPELSVDAIFGLSDSLALGAYDAYAAGGRSGRPPLTLGINGDPLALAAVAEGRMAATVETDVSDIAAQAVQLAYRAACGEQLPSHFHNLQRLVTAENVGEVATRKLISLADLPTRLVGVNRRIEQQRALQLETSLALNRQVGLILDKQQLSLAISELIRTRYGYDLAQLWIWNRETGELVDAGVSAEGEDGLAPDPRGPLAYALGHNRAVFLPDTRASHRFAPDPAWPETRARLVVPVRVGGEIIGLLDLHRRRIMHNSRHQVDGLQLLADQLGIAMRNAELYGQALAARAEAEKADQLKTRLLANVSHELRTPLEVILGHSRAALEQDGATHTPALRQSLAHIQRNGEHLMQLIGDLLDLSRAEIDELDLAPQLIDTREFLEELFRSSAAHFGVDGDVLWQLEAPPLLPPIEADPVRLRQVLLNLLHNAHKATRRGQITLGAEVTAARLHLWVADTGAGIPLEVQAQIFEPFVTYGAGPQAAAGIGLGLSIAKRLVALHHGTLLLESAPSSGSTFHVMLPLPQPAAPGLAHSADPPLALLLIGEDDEPPAEIARLAERRALEVRQLPPGASLTSLLQATRPAVVAWDLTAGAQESSSILQQIRSQPQLRQLPLILFHRDHASGRSAATSLLLKPLSDRALIEAIDDLRPRSTHGSILIVDDEPQARALHQRMVAAHLSAHTVYAVDGGRAALEILARETPDLIILDLAMPDVDGFAVLEAVRASPRTRQVPVLVMSGRMLGAEDIRRLGMARVVYQSKELLSEGELGASMRRALAGGGGLPPHTSALVKQAVIYMQQHYNTPLSLQAIAGAVGISKDYLGRIFQHELGLSPWEYLLRYRVLCAKELLRTTTFAVAEVATRVGFDDAAYFSRIFHQKAGCSPRDFRGR